MSAKTYAGTFELKDKTYSMGFANISNNQLGDKSYPLIEISELELHSNSESNVSKSYVVNDPVFLLDTSGLPYLHFMQDAMGQLLLLKSRVPNLKLKILANSEQDALEFYENYRLKYCWPIFVESEVTQDTFIILDEHPRVVLSTLILISPDAWSGYQKVFNESGSLYSLNITNKTNIAGFREYEDYRVDTASALNNYFKKFKTFLPPSKKLFISRSGEETVARAMEKYITMADNGLDIVLDESDSKLVKRLALDPSSRKFYSDMLKYRMFSYEDMNLIEDYYVRVLNYKIVRLEEFSIIDQIYLLSSSSHVAGLAGSGMYNCIYCLPDTKIDIIVPSDLFFVGRYDNLFGTILKEYKSFPEIANYTGGRIYRAEDALSDIRKQQDLGRYD